MTLTFSVWGLIGWTLEAILVVALLVLVRILLVVKRQLARVQEQSATAARIMTDEISKAARSGRER